MPASMSASASFAGLSSTITPRETQLPTTIFTAAFKSLASMLVCFVFAIEIICSIARLPILVSSGLREFLPAPASFFINSATGGENTRTLNCFVLGLTSISTGTFMPLNDPVAVLTSEITFPRLIPRGPSCCAIEGPGFMLPPSTISLTIIIYIVSRSRFTIVTFNFRFTLAPDNSYVIYLNSYRNRHSRAQERDHYFALLLVNANDFSLFFLEQIRNHLNNISNFNVIVLDFRLHHIFNFFVCERLANYSLHIRQIKHRILSRFAVSRFKQHISSKPVRAHDCKNA